MKEDLEDLIRELIKAPELSERINKYIDYKAKYVILKPSVKVTVELTKGIVFTADISDYFEEDIK